MIVSIHIPKTAGTALGMYLDNGRDHRLVFDYGHAIANTRAFILTHKPLLERFGAVHGHFRYTKYNWAFPDAIYITVMRNPVDRTISNYQHLMRDRDPGNFLYRRIKKYNLDVVGFSELPLIRDTQYQMLRGRDIMDYEFVGMSEEFEASVQALSRMLSMPVVAPFKVGGLFNWRPQVNVNARAHVLRRLGLDGITNDVRKKIAGAVAEDMELYRRGRERFGQIKAKYLG